VRVPLADDDGAAGSSAHSQRSEMVIECAHVVGVATHEP
jgi:hypothetical protein